MSFIKEEKSGKVIGLKVSHCSPWARN